MGFPTFSGVFFGGEIVDMVSQSGAVAKFVLTRPSCLQPGIVGDHSVEVGHIAAGARAERTLRPRLPQSAAAAGHRLRWRSSFVPARWLEFSRADSKNSGGRWEAAARCAALLAIQRAMQISRIGRDHVASSATCPGWRSPAAVTPFVGLFGTVWGIIDAFHGLGTAGAATLRAVAPGISEALITTAAGLAAAIPAVIAYNLIGNSIREFAARRR